jgi:hypothetical protein
VCLSLRDILGIVSRCSSYKLVDYSQAKTIDDQQKLAPTASVQAPDTSTIIDEARPVDKKQSLNTDRQDSSRTRRRDDQHLRNESVPSHQSIPSTIAHAGHRIKLVSMPVFKAHLPQDKSDTSFPPS